MSYWKCYEPLCNNSGHYQVGIFINKYFCIGILGILCIKIQFKSEFGQAHCAEWLKTVHTKFILKILDIPTSFYKFWKFELISAI
jgi:hypothetical protein